MIASFQHLVRGHPVQVVVAVVLHHNHLPVVVNGVHRPAHGHLDVFQEEAIQVHNLHRQVAAIVSSQHKVHGHRVQPAAVARPHHHLAVVKHAHHPVRGHPDVFQVAVIQARNSHLHRPEAANHAHHPVRGRPDAFQEEAVQTHNHNPQQHLRPQLVHCLAVTCSAHKHTRLRILTR